MADNNTGARTRLTDLVAEEIRALLARRRMSGRELARRLGETPSWVNYRLTGQTPIDLNDLQRFADVLDVRAADLLPAGDLANTLRNFETSSDLPEQPAPHPDSQPERPRRNPRRQTTRPGSNPPAGAPDERTRRPALIRRVHSV